MRIRAKLALGFTAIAATAVAVAGTGFLNLQERTYRVLQERDRRALLGEVQRSAEEADFSRDPLMLFDDLSFMIRNHPEVSWCRVQRRGRWMRVDPRRPRDPADVLVESVRYKGRAAAASVLVDVAFSRSYQESQRRQASGRALADMLRTAYFVLPISLALSLLLSRAWSRRLEALEGALEEIGKGRLGLQTSIGGADEIGRLAAGLNAMSRRLEELEGMKKTFIASVTHELRSPLAVIESSVHLMLSESEVRPQIERNMLRSIQASAARLGHFVTNLLDMAKIERGKLDMRPESVEMEALLEDAVLFFQPKAKEAAVNLRWLGGGNPPSRLRADPDLITQVLTNLISNAIKFTPAGGAVEVAARRVEMEGRPWLECEVKDTGPGIPRQALGRLFTPFERIPNPVKVGGAGLGLAISKAIIEMHAGVMGAESEPGRGSRFFFRLPL